MKKYIFILMFSLIGFFVFLSGHLQPVTKTSKPQLIVQIVIDQLRGDLIFKYQHQFGNNGFNYLINHGIDYHNTHHPHANTTTCAGHATIATGSFPALHGIINNDWYDRTSKQFVYCMEDLNTKIVPTRHTVPSGSGRSPRNLSVSTLSDEVILSQKGRAFGVSFKDRSAIILAGHAGKAFWFDMKHGGFITSNYYYHRYPNWIKDWNNNYTPLDFDWNLSRPNNQYQNEKSPLFSHQDELFGQTFPHHITNVPPSDYFKSLSRTPKADQLTANFAEHLLIEEHLGQTPNQTDYLGISLSSVDAIGHQFGPNSLEAEDNLLELDKTLAHLFAQIDKRVGLKNTLIVLTADHGVNDSPAYLRSHHIKEVKPINIQALTHLIQQTLVKEYHLPPQTLLSITLPFVYLDHQLIQDHHLKLNAVSRILVHAFAKQPGIFKAYALPLDASEKDWLSVKVKKMDYPNRSGDIYLVPPPNQSKGAAKSPDRVTHGSPWQYDSFVPLLFAHPNFKTQRIYRATSTTDIASTLSAVLAIKTPSAAVGQPLEEVMREFN